MAEAEPIVSKWRLQFDPSAAAGVPAHVTLLYPFKPSELIDQTLIDELAAFFEEWPPFDSEFKRTDRFGSEVLWLAPEPAEAFRSLTVALVEKYPEFPPYGGDYGDITPHLTVAHASHGGDIERIDEGVSQSLPISSTVKDVWLMEEGVDGRWRKRAEFPLGGW
ncbi:MAG: 2'-5' RNA ligase family protein [Acidimicrobiia bacterium]